jgi:hypothetical protein
MATIQMKWHNLNLSWRVVINSGAALLLYLVSFFLLTHMAAHNPGVQAVYPIGVAALDVAFGGFLVKRANNNKLASTEAVEKLKMAAVKPGEGDAESK